MTDVCPSVLKQRSVTRVRVNDELRIGQMRAKGERIDARNHDVVVPVCDKYVGTSGPRERWDHVHDKVKVLRLRSPPKTMHRGNH